MARRPRVPTVGAMTTTSRPARRRTAPLRPAALAAGAVLLLGGGLVACEGGASLCLNDNTCDVVVRTDGETPPAPSRSSTVTGNSS